MESGDDTEDLVGGESGDDTGDLAANEWRRQWRLSGWGLETTMET